MGFWGTAGAEALAGATVAIVAAILALLVTDRYAAARERAQASRERDLAAAADLYQLLGKFFTAWKTWEFHSRSPSTHPVSDQRHSELIAEAAAAEGAYEAFIVRVVLEHDLSEDQRAALWGLRFALKELRYAMREGKPLKWWRSDFYGLEPGHREYEAYKGLVAIVTGILTQPSLRNAQRGKADRAAALKQVTGSGKGITDTARIRELAKEQQKPIEDWVLLAEQLGQAKKADGQGLPVSRSPGLYAPGRDRASADH